MGKRTARLIPVEMTLFGILGGMTFAAKWVMAGIPNVEPVSLMVMLFAVTFGWKAVFPIYIYVLMEFLLYGVRLWSINYIYVWLVLAAAAWLLRDMRNPLGWALLSGVFGLLFGLLCAPVYLISVGPQGMAAWWISGIPFDMIHCAGNFVVALGLFIPMRDLLERLYGEIKARAEGKPARPSKDP